MKENDNWYSQYNSEELQKRRIKKHRKKYLSYGLPQKTENQVLLDLCCGSAEFSRLIAKHNPQSLVLGCDIFLEKKSLYYLGNLFFFSADAISLSLPDSSVDQIFCFHSLHHLDGPGRWQRLVDEFHRVLKNGGYLHLVDHYPSPWLRLAFIAVRSPLSLMVPWLKKFREQLKLEEEILSYWFENWEVFFHLVNQAGFERTVWSKKIFFFYSVFKKITQ